MSLLRALVGIPFGLFFITLTPLIVLVNVLIPKSRYLAIQARGAESEIQGRLAQLDGEIEASDKVLDIGAGAGRFGHAIAVRFGAEVEGVDVVDYVNAPIPVEIYDGVEIPHEDGSFDTVVLAFMLHHVEDQAGVMAEAVRVARRKVIVMEDAYRYGWQKPFVIWNDYYSNLILGAVKVFRGAEGRGILSIPMPLTFRSLDGWVSFFEGFDLAQKQLLLRSAIHKPHTKATFILEKKSS